MKVGVGYGCSALTPQCVAMQASPNLWLCPGLYMVNMETLLIKFYMGRSCRTIRSLSINWPKTKESGTLGICIGMLNANTERYNIEIGSVSNYISLADG